MKVVFSCFMGSKDNHEPAYTVREQANKLFAVYHGSHPLQKDIGGKYNYEQDEYLEGDIKFNEILIK